MKKFIKDLFQQSFTRNGKIHPPYIYLWVLLLSVLICIAMRFLNFKHIDNTLVGILCGHVVAWLGLFKVAEIKK